MTQQDVAMLWAVPEGSARRPKENESESRDMGCLGSSVAGWLPSAQVMITGFPDRALLWAPCSARSLLPLSSCPSPGSCSFPFSLSNK